MGKSDKGYIQLAIRSGQYKRINVLPVKDGELIKHDPFNEIIEFKAIENPLEREKAQDIGYYAVYETHSGFTKHLYWSKEQMEAHALEYSKGYKAKKGYTFWEKSFNDMACKTMLRQLLSKWGLLSIELQQAYNNDMSMVNENNGNFEPTYVDNPQYDNEVEVEIVESESLV